MRQDDTRGRLEGPGTTLLIPEEQSQEERKATRSILKVVRLSLPPGKEGAQGPEAEAGLGGQTRIRTATGPRPRLLRKDRPQGQEAGRQTWTRSASIGGSTMM